MITAEFELELLCFMREFEDKGYEFSLNRNYESYKGIDISIHVACPHPFKIIAARKSTPFIIGNSVFLKSSQTDLEQFIKTVKLYDQVNNKRAA